MRYKTELGDGLTFKPPDKPTNTLSLKLTLPIGENGQAITDHFRNKCQSCPLQGYPPQLPRNYYFRADGGIEFFTSEEMQDADLRFKVSCTGMQPTGKFLFDEATLTFGTQSSFDSLASALAQATCSAHDINLQAVPLTHK